MKIEPMKTIPERVEAILEFVEMSRVSPEEGAHDLALALITMMKGNSVTAAVEVVQHVAKDPRVVARLPS